MTSIVLLSALLLLAPLRASAQSAEPLRPVIRGVVLERDTNQPVAGAELVLASRDSGSLLVNGGWTVENAKTIADETGGFTISLARPGSYRVQAKKPGYGRAASGSPDYAEVKLSTEEPAADVRLFLARFGALSGAVVDDDTGKPLPNLRLRVMRAQARGMRFFPGDGAVVTTAADGQFTATGLPPGDYAVEIMRQHDAGKRVLSQFTDKDADTTDLDYENTFWPGGQGPDAALPVSLASGASVWVGRLHARKVPYYRLRVRVPQSDCQPGETMRVSESIVHPGGILFTPPLGETPCGKDILVTGYPRGSFRLFLTVNGRERETRATASVPFVIGDRNIAIFAPLLPGVTVDGAIVVADLATKPDFAKVTVGLRAVDGQGSLEDERPSPDADGRFRITRVRPVGHTVQVSGLGTSHYVKEIRHNGAALTGGVVPLDMAAMTHMLTVVVDDKVATMAGSVSTADGPAGRATVIAAKWPWDPALAAGLRRGQADVGGRFQIAGLAPGEYRVIALDSAGIQALMNVSGAEEMQRVMAVGKKVELTPGGLQNISLELSVVPVQ